MKTPRSFRSFLVHGLLAAALSTTAAFAISQEDLAVLRAKAETGNGIAQYNLGLVYAAVSDPIADPIEAYVWFNLAADNGATGRALVLLSSRLTKEQIVEAKQRLETRRAELEAKKKKAATTANPVSAVEGSPVSDSRSPIVAAPSLPDPPISAAPISDREFSLLQAELKKLSAELSNSWKENEQLKAAVAKGGQPPVAPSQLQTEHEQLRAALASANVELEKLRAEAVNFENERVALEQKAVVDAQAHKANLEADAATATNKLRTIESQLTQARSAGEELAAAKQTISKLTEQVGKTAAEIERLTSLAAQAGSSTQAKTAAEKDLVALRAELAAARPQLAAVKTEKDAALTARKQAEESQIKLETALRTIESQKNDVDQLQKAVTSLTSERENFGKQLAALKVSSSQPDPASEKRIVQLNADLETARAAGRQVTQLQKMLSDRDAKLKAIESDLAAAAQDKDLLGKQLAAAKAAPVVPSAELTQLNTELVTTRKRLATAEQALVQSKDERDRASQEASRIAQAQLTDLKSELQQLRQKSSVSEESLAKIEKERTALRQQLADTLAGSTAELATARANLKSSQDALAGARAEHAVLADRLSAAENKANMMALIPAPAPGEDPAKLRDELDETQTKLNAALRTYQLQQDEMERLQKSLAQIEAERTQLADRARDLNTQANEAQTQATANQEAAAQLAAVREQFRQAQNQIASLAGENSQLRNRVAVSGPPPSTSPAITPSGPLGSPSRSASSSPSPQAMGAVNRSAPTVPTRPAAPPAARVHTVADGDTLTKIARRYYGNSDRWPQILDANRTVIRDVNNLTLGSSLRIP